MTVNFSLAVSGPYTCDGVTTDFGFTFRLISAAHLEITVYNATTGATVSKLVNGSGYSVLTGGLKNDAGGTVRLTTAPAAGNKISIGRAVPYSQPNRIGNQGAFLPETHETTFDLLAMQIQQLSRKVGAGMTLPITDDPTLDMTLPNSTARANRVLAFDATGKPVAGADSASIAAAGDAAAIALLSAASSNDYATSSAASAAAAAASAAAAAGFDPTAYLPKTGGAVSGSITVRGMQVLPDYNAVFGVGRYSLAYGGAAIDAQGSATFMSMQLGGFEIFRYSSAGITLNTGKALVFGDGTSLTTASSDPIGAMKVAAKGSLGANWIQAGAIYTKASYPALAALLGQVSDGSTQTAIGVNSVYSNSNQIIGPAAGLKWCAAGNGSGILLVGRSGLSAVSRSINGGVSWLSQVTPIQFNSIVWDGTTFVAVGTGATQNIYTSPDGATWTTRTNVLPASLIWTSITVNYSLGRLCAVSSLGVITTSDDHGVTWTMRFNYAFASSTSTFLVDRIGANGFCAANNNGVYYSADGATWVKNSTKATVANVCGSPTGRMVGISNAADTVPTVAKNDFVYSDDFGVTWTRSGTTAQIGAGGNTNGYQNFGIQYSMNRFVAGYYACLDTDSDGQPNAYMVESDGASGWTEVAGFWSLGNGYSLAGGGAGALAFPEDAKLASFTYASSVGGNIVYAGVISERSYSSTQFFVPFFSYSASIVSTNAQKFHPAFAAYVRAS